MKFNIEPFFDKDTWTLSYVVYDDDSKDAIVLDPVWDYDPASSTMSTNSIDHVFEFIKSKELQVHFILDTHAHADHVSGSQVLKQKIPTAKVGIGIHITKVQSVFKSVFHLHPEFKVDGSQFDLLLEQGKTYHAGTLKVQVIYTPGHTPACSSYIIEDAVFTGDTLFMPDYGTGRCDFPAGSASDLYDSVQKIYQLPDSMRVFTGHDYMPNGRNLRFESTIKEQKQNNIHINLKTTKNDFIAFRTQRDKTLSAPRLLLPSVQVNIDAGHLPKKEENGMRYLKIPVKES